MLSSFIVLYILFHVFVLKLRVEVASFVLSNILLFISSPSIGQTSHRCQNPPRNSSPPHCTFPRAAASLVFLQICCMKSNTMRWKISAVSRFLPPTVRLACLTADASRPHHERRVFLYVRFFFLSKCVSASPLPRTSSKEKKNVPFADATSGTGLWRWGWRWAQPVAGVTRGKWRGCLGRPFPRVGARSFHRESLDPRGLRSRPMWGCGSPWDGAGEQSSPVSPTSAFRREWNPVYPWYDGQYVLRTTPPPIPLPHF